MAIENMRVTRARFDSEVPAGNNSARIYDGEPAGSPFLEFETMSDEACSESFVLSVSWRGVRRATASMGDTAYGPWTECPEAVVPISSLLPDGKRENDSGMRYSWSIPLSLIPGLAPVFEGGWGFASRRYDEVNVLVRARSRYRPDIAAEWGCTESPTSDFPTQGGFFVGWFPSYSLAAAEFGMSGKTTISLSRSAGWLRADDRWEITSLEQGGRELLRQGQAPWGHLGTSLKAVVEPSFLAAFPRDSSEAGPLRVTLRVNAAYKAVGSVLAKIDGGGVNAVDRGTAPAPQLTLATSATMRGVPEGALRCNVVARDGAQLTSASVRLVGGAYSFDQATAALSGGRGSCDLPFPPLDVPLEVECVGYGLDVKSKPARATCAEGAPSGGVGRLDALEGGASARMRYDVERSWQVARVQESAKFAGRDLASVAFGRGGQATRSMSCRFLPGDPEGGGEADFRAVAEAGLVVARMPGGDRALCAVKSAGASASFDSPVLEATLELEEVCE